MKSHCDTCECDFTEETQLDFLSELIGEDFNDKDCDALYDKLVARLGEVCTAHLLLALVYASLRRDHIELLLQRCPGNENQPLPRPHQLHGDWEQNTLMIMWGNNRYWIEIVAPEL